MRDRMLWGGYKNLISGVTTVCHHNPYHPVCENGFPVRVVKDVAWTHSLTYSKDPVGDFKKAQGRPFVIHAAEGVDDSARLEITELQRLGILRENTVIVHGVGVKNEEIKRLQRAGAALIWCPSSNIRLFGKTAPIDQMSGRVLVTLGTDSLLTANPTLFHELRAALDTGLATPASDAVVLVVRIGVGTPATERGLVASPVRYGKTRSTHTSVRPEPTPVRPRERRPVRAQFLPSGQS